MYLKFTIGENNSYCKKLNQQTKFLKFCYV